jgi:hypothetical protein
MKSSRHLEINRRFDAVPCNIARLGEEGSLKIQSAMAMKRIVQFAWAIAC